MSQLTLTDRLSKICKPDYIDNNIALIDDAKHMVINKEYLLDDISILMFVRSGSMDININGERQSVNHLQALLCRSGYRVSHLSFSEDFSGHAVLLTSRYGHGIINVTGNIWNLLLSLDSSPVVELPQSTRTRLLSYYSVLAAEIKSHTNLYYHEVVSSIIKAMLYSLVNDFRQIAKEANFAEGHLVGKYNGSAQPLSLFNRFVEILINEQSVERKIDYYAKRLCVTPKYLSTVCKQVSNRTAHEWICAAVVNSIENYLVYSNYSIKEVAVKFGFSTLSFFSKFVKQHLGHPPTYFRKPQSEDAPGV